jgi:signal transduction histidine kinase
MNLRGYDEIGSLPESLREWAQTNPNEGLYEFNTEELHVAVIPADNEHRQAFVVFDVAGIEAASSEDWWWLLVIAGVVGTLGALGFALGVLVMRRAVAPVAELAKVVAGIDLEKLSAEDHKRIESSRFGDDEVGVLAGTIEKTLERISAFVARERYFTSSASHELRTPITVITGALELLEQSDLTATDVKVVDRVRRATLEKRDERFHLGWNHAASFDKNRDGRRRQVRQHVQRTIPDGESAPDQQDRGEKQHDGPVV